MVLNGEDEIEEPVRPRREKRITQEDVGETVATDDIFDENFTTEDFGGEIDASGIFFDDAMDDNDGEF